MSSAPGAHLLLLVSARVKVHNIFKINVLTQIASKVSYRRGGGKTQDSPPMIDPPCACPGFFQSVLVHVEQVTPPCGRGTMKCVKRIPPKCPTFNFRAFFFAFLGKHTPRPTQWVHAFVSSTISTSAILFKSPPHPDLRSCKKPWQGCSRSAHAHVS